MNHQNFSRITRICNYLLLKTNRALPLCT